jgi:hypothetical protein
MFWCDTGPPVLEPKPHRWQEYLYIRLYRLSSAAQVGVLPWVIAPLLTATLTRYQEEFYKTMPADIASGKIK